MSEVVNVDKKEIVLILGMHRSGTSLIARYISELGYSIGVSVMHPSYDNPQGFYENDAIVELNNILLHKCRSKWDLPVLLTSQLEKQLTRDYFKEHFEKILDNEFPGDAKILIKDPRICLLLPLYQGYFEKNLKYNLKIIWILRHPEGVIQSLAKRNRFNRSKSQYLYNRYNLEVYQALTSHTHLSVTYEDILQEPDILDDRIKEFLNVDKEILPRLSKLIVQPKTSTIDNSGRTEKSEKAKKLYEILTSKELSKKEDSDVQKLIFDVEEETSIIDSWTQRQYFSRLVGVTRESKTEEINSFIAQSGWNVIQWHNKEKLFFKELEFTPINNAASIEFTEVLINGEGVRWESRGMIKDGVKHHSNSPNAKIVIPLGEDIDTLYVRYFVKTTNYLDETLGKGRDLETLLATRTQDNLQLLESQKSLRTFIKEQQKNVNSNQIQIRDLRRLDNTVQELTKQIHEEKKSTEEFVDRLMNEFKISFKALNQEIGGLKNQIESSKENKEKLRLAHHEVISLKKETEQLKLKTSDLEHEKVKSQDRINTQHKEISEFKKAYSEREGELDDRRRELADISASVSYKAGRIITMPARKLYEGSKRLMLFLSFVVGGGLIFMKNPTKAIALISSGSFVTLFRAIRDEPYDRIIRNIKSRLNILREPKLKEEIRVSDKVPQTKATKKTILYISPNLPDYDQSSGGKRANKMLELLSSFADVSVFTLGSRPAKYKKHISDKGISIIDSYSSSDVFKALPNIDVIIFAWFYTLHDNADILKRYPNALKIVDSVDVHWVREERSIGHIKALTKEKVRQNKESEIASYHHADIIWTVTDNDRKAVQKELPKSFVSVVSNIHDVYIRDYNPIEDLRILFFGGYNHPPNLTALDILINEIRPKVLKTLAGVTFVIAGSKAPKEVIRYGELQGVEYLGFIPEDEINELYDKAHLVVAPLAAGAGIKGKICEAISYGVPVLTTDIGNEGINLVDNVDGFVSDIESMADRIIGILTSDVDMKSIVEASKLKLDKIVGPDYARRQMFKDVHPMVTICIVTWNRLDLLKKCISSVLKHTSYPFYRVVVHSNGCSDGTQEYLQDISQRYHQIIPRLSPTNDVFVRPNNEMMMEFEDSDILLLNNDTEVTDRWLTSLREAAYTSDNIGIAGSKLLYPDGRLQEFGSELYIDGTGRNIGKGEDPMLPQYNVVKRVGYVSGCAMYIKRSTIDKIGIFDDQFHPCYCEDSDYAYSAWEQGLETVVTPESVVIHYEGGTSGTDEESGFKAYQKVNLDKFLSKHREKLEGLTTHINKINERHS